MFRNFKLLEIVTEYAFHDGIRVKVFDFWFYLMEKIRFSMFVGVIYRDRKANMTHITLFFDRTDRDLRCFGFPEDVPLSVRDKTRHSSKCIVPERVVFC